MKPPSRSLLCNWVKSSWDAISIDTIKKSFLSCAITLSTDGSKDDEIHCFKEGQPCADGKILLSEELKKLEAESDPSDPFEEEPDDEELEENEVCMDDDGVSEEMEEEEEEEDDEDDN